MRRLKWWVRGLGQSISPRFTLAVLANRTWVLEPEVALVPLLSRRKGLAVDIGANKGVYLFHLSRHFKRVAAFEPLPVLARYLKRAAPANVVVTECAISDRAGEAELQLPRGFNELGSLEAHTAATWTTNAELESHAVALRTLDACCLSDVALIKIDVEGHELSVLAGAGATIDTYRPTVLVEVEERHRSSNVDAVRCFFESKNYRGFFLDGYQLRPMQQFDLTRDQPIASLSQSVKVDRYINNFIYFHVSEAADRCAVISAALRQRSSIELSLALEPGHRATVREKLAGPARAARDLLTTPRLAS
jgi:FkbM family methyltransferase